MTTYYAPAAFDTDEFIHELADPNDIYALCGKQVDNSGDNLRDHRPTKHSCPKCDKVAGREEKSGSDDKPSRSTASANEQPASDPGSGDAGSAGTEASGDSQVRDASSTV